MKIISILSLILFLNVVWHRTIAQNVGIGTTTPQGRLHIKGNANISQLTIDAAAGQTNVNPLINLRDAAGNDLLHISSDAAFNVFMGYGTGRVNVVSLPNQYGLYNTFIGSNSGYFNTEGSFNTSIGRSSLYQNTTANHNTGLGYKALFSATQGGLNTAVGSQALLSNINGYENTAVGYSSLLANTNASGNTAIGYLALSDQSFPNGGILWYTENTALGWYALKANQPTTNANGNLNTALGSRALRSNTTGLRNTATGVGAGSGNTTGNFNSFFGYNTASSPTSSDYNSFFGYRAGFNNSGPFNTAVGAESLFNNTGGYDNTALGTAALYNCTSGAYNTAVGNNADIDLGNSNYNTVVGTFAHVTGSNNVVVGYNAFTNSNGLAQLGNTTTVFCGGYANWTNYASDKRIKTAVNEDVKGLDFILRLRPVTYHLDVRSIYKLWDISPYGKKEKEMTADAKADMDNSIRIKEGVRMSGFIAQEVEKAAQESAYDFDGIKKPENEKDHYGLAYETFVVPLVKAVQEQQVIIKNQQQEMIELKQRISKLETMLVK